jgi:transcriptional regulator with XRE-family HTH domain
MIGRDIDAISARLRALRESRGQNQADFCKSVGISKSAWNNYETGDRRLSLEAALQLCDETGVTLDWIYRGVKYGLPSALADAIHNVESGKQIHAA